MNMEILRSNKVVNITDYKIRMNTEDTKTTELLNECQSLMSDRLSQSLSLMMDKADDVLFDLAQRGGPKEHPFYFNAMREIRLKRTSIETAFRDRFSESFTEAIHKIEQDPSAYSDEENINEDVDIEELLAVTNTSGKIRHDCQEALLSLDEHMATLLEDVKIDRRQNPVYPERVCTAFQDACREIESGIEIKLILFKLFEKYVTSGLQDVYAEIDGLLTEKRLSKQTDMSVQNPIRPAGGNQQIFTSTNNIIKDKNYFIIANRIIRNEITEHLGSANVPKFVRDFLFTHWSKLMMKIHMRDGTDTKAWQHAVEVIDDLVNCIGSNTSLTEKRSLAPMMPNLIQRLKYGMNVIPVSPTVREEFISELVQYHKNRINEENNPDKTDRNLASEDVTVPRFKTRISNIPFMDELLVDNKKKS
ncbi:MAG TPA: DUF1631 family protein [Gammaproteobacteria bacterium]|nr:DUF1631 family protein [Gammaproteobacteria bacterium]